MLTRLFEWLTQKPALPAVRLGSPWPIQSIRTPAEEEADLAEISRLVLAGDTSTEAMQALAEALGQVLRK